MVNCMSVVTIALTCVYILFVYSDLFKLIRIVAFLVGLIMHLLYLNWVGQQIINSSEQVFISAYFSDWYLIPNSTKKFINIIMIRSLVPCTLTSGKLANLSMENFGILLKSAMSYFTVILSFYE
ncbi:odorant receptor 30a-like [Phymastichus coffea]|nr:odorant receptor 30a-like [Phymastichus coffea]